MLIEENKSPPVVEVAQTQRAPVIGFSRVSPNTSV